MQVPARRRRSGRVRVPGSHRQRAAWASSGRHAKRRRSTMLGTPAYMAPEGEASVQSDLYAVGCVLYGRSPPRRTATRPPRPRRRTARAPWPGPDHRDSRCWRAATTARAGTDRRRRPGGQDARGFGTDPHTDDGHEHALRRRDGRRDRRRRRLPRNPHTDTHPAGRNAHPDADDSRRSDIHGDLHTHTGADLDAHGNATAADGDADAHSHAGSAANLDAHAVPPDAHAHAGPGKLRVHRQPRP